MNFQYSLLIFAIVLVILGSLILKYSVSSSVRGEKWPPYVANCPDYWTDTTGDGKACKSSTINIGFGQSCNGIVNFSSMDNCQKYNTSNQCGIYWDGINYGNPYMAKTCS